MLHPSAEQFAVEPPRTLNDVFAILGGPAAFGRAIGKSTEHAAAMRRRRSIPARYWPAIVHASEGRVSHADLLRVHTRELQGSAPAEAWPAISHVSPREAVPASHPSLRLVEISGDSLQPLLHRGDFVLAAAVTEWAGEGLYVTGNAFGEDAVYDCSVTGSRAMPRIILGSTLMIAGRRVYADELVTTAEFARIVTGKVLLTCQVKDREFFRHLQAA